MNQAERKIIQTFKTGVMKYEKLEKVAREAITKAIGREKISVMSVMGRVKDLDSLYGKIEHKAGKYTSISDITDLCGIRVICYFSDGVDRVGKLLEDLFDVDWNHSIDKREMLEATQFGYLSLHYVCVLTKEKGYEDEICGIPFEIQIRTVLQHAWAEIEHDLGYKSEFGIPKVLRRKFSQIAGLLEVADQQFVEVRQKSVEYTQTIRENIDDESGMNIELDQVSLREYLRANRTWLSVKEEFSGQLSVEIVDNESEEFIRNLAWLRITTVRELSEFLLRNKDYALKKIKAIVDLLELDIITNSMMMRYLFYGEIRAKGYTRKDAEKFLSLSIKDKSKIRIQLDEIFSKE